MGDELVKIDVEIPLRLNDEQRKAIEQFARASGEDISKSGFGDKIKRAFK